MPDTLSVLLRRVILGSMLAWLASGVASAQVAPQLPQVYLQTDPVPATGRTLSVAAGASLQAALDQAVAGDVIALQAGATFTGPFRLPVKAGAGWITIRTSAADSQLPAPGQRIGPAYAGVLPKIVTTGAAAALTTDRGAHHYRFVGIEFAVATGVATNYGIVTLGDPADTATSQLPHDIIFDRVYVHGQTTGNVRRGIALNGASCAVIDSYISEIHEVGADSQAIAVWNGTGPFKIVNNYLEAAGENVLFGGADPTIPNLVPSDIEVRRNWMVKPRKWRQGDPSYAGILWTVKNIFELKNAQRVLVEGNRFEYNWLQAQNGFSILFTPRNQQGTAPWTVVQDVTFINNLVQHVAAAINLLGRDDIYTSQQTRRIRISNNLFVDVSSANWGGSGRLLQSLAGPADVIVEHNTSLQNGDVIFANGTATTAFTFRNNLVANGAYGVAGDGTFGNPLTTISTYFPSAIFVGNAFVGGTASLYPTGNYFPSTWAQVAFVNSSGGDYRLSSVSPYKYAGTDGRDIGVDIDALSAAMADAVAPTPPPPPPPTGGGTDTSAPTATLTTPVNGASVSGNVAIAATANDNVGVAGVRFVVDGAQVGADATVAPYTTTWNSMSMANGTHMIRAEAYDAAGNLGSTATISVTVMNSTTSTPTPVGEPVAWTRVTNALASGNSLSKSGGCDGCPDSGGSSSQAIRSGAGYLEFTVDTTSAQFVVGLSNGDTDTSEEDVDYALKFWPGGTAEVRFNGRSQSVETRVAVGDVFRVAVADQNTITFSKNGAVFHRYRARRRLSYPLLVDVSLGSTIAGVRNARMGGVPTTTAPTGAVTWTQMVNVALISGVLTKIAGCDGCQDGGAVSTQTVSSSGGYVQFSAPDTVGSRVIGLSAGNAGTTEDDIDFGWKLWPGGGADVRENGAYVNVETTYSPSDVFRVAVSNGVVSYLKNGQVLYRSARTPAATLLVDTSFSGAGSKLAGVVVGQ